MKGFAANVEEKPEGGKTKHVYLFIAITGI